MDPDISEYGEDSFADRMIYKDSSDTPQYLEGSDAINVNTPNDVVISSSGEPGSDGRFLDKAEPFNRQKPNEEADTSAAEPTDNENEESPAQKQSEETSESNSSETSDTSASSNTQKPPKKRRKRKNLLMPILLTAVMPLKNPLLPMMKIRLQQMRKLSVLSVGESLLFIR